MSETSPGSDVTSDSEHVDVLIVGAGLSGIGAAHHVTTACPWASYAVFEAREAIGGTWDLFRYPGVRSDSDMFTLGYSFRPWQGEKAIADGGSILQYIRDTATEAGIDQKIRYRHRIVAADWETDHARWRVTAERTDPDTEIVDTIELTCGFLYSCTGYYRYDHGYEPEFEGRSEFGGTIVHPQFWPGDLDVTGKRVVVIGSGATAITLIPSLAETTEHVTMLQRSPTYIASLPEKNPIANLLRRVMPTRWSGPTVRWFNALMTQGSYKLSRLAPKLMKRILRAGVAAQLPKGFDVATHFTPTYDPWDQRLCVVPNGDLFAAIRHGRASVVTDHVDHFTERGIRLQSGDELEADIIVTATGLQMLFIGGMQLSVDGEVVEPSGRLLYKGMMIEGVPNLAIALGYTNASWTLKADLTADYVCRLLDHMRRNGQQQCVAISDGATATDDDVFGLTSGYVTRSAHLLPKQGSQHPWRVYHSYLADYRSLKRGDVVDATMRFSARPTQTTPTQTTPTSTSVAPPDRGDSTTKEIVNA